MKFPDGFNVTLFAGEPDSELKAVRLPKKIADAKSKAVMRQFRNMACPSRWNEAIEKETIQSIPRISGQNASVLSKARE